MQDDSHDDRKTTSTPSLWARSDKVLRPISAFFMVTIYVVLGALVMNLSQELDWNESVYFMIVTTSTVGYGDISPETPALKIFVLIWALIGIIVIFTQLTGVVVLFTRGVTHKGRQRLQKLKDMVIKPTLIDVDGDGVADFRVPEGAFFYYCRDLLPSILIMLVVQLISAGAFTGIEEMDYGDAFYHCMITATTIGYGDMAIETSEGRWFASVHIFVSVAMLGEIISTFDTLREERKEKMGRLELLHNKLDPKLYEHIMERIQGDCKSGDCNISKGDFLSGMLVEAGAVSEQQFKSTTVIFEQAANGSDTISPDALKKSIVQLQSRLYVSQQVASGAIKQHCHDTDVPTMDPVLPVEPTPDSEVESLRDLHSVEEFLPDAQTTDDEPTAALIKEEEIQQLADAAETAVAALGLHLVVLDVKNRQIGITKPIEFQGARVSTKDKRVLEMGTDAHTTQAVCANEALVRLICNDIAHAISTVNHHLLVMQRQPFGLLVGGHTSSSSNSVLAERISSARAQVVSDFIREALQRIDPVAESKRPTTIRFHGYGSTRPLPGFDDGGNHPENRRVEVTLLFDSHD